MGVKGWNRLLASYGYIPDNRQHDKSHTNENTLWMSDFSLINETYLECIPNNATLHIDGNSLSFFIQRIAYSRIIESILQQIKLNNNTNTNYNGNTNGNTNNTNTPNSPYSIKLNNKLNNRNNHNKNSKNNRKSKTTTPIVVEVEEETKTIELSQSPSPKKKSNNNNDITSVFTTQQINDLLPYFCPLQIIHDVTVEFINGLSGISNSNSTNTSSPSTNGSTDNNSNNNSTFATVGYGSFQIGTSTHQQNHQQQNQLRKLIIYWDGDKRYNFKEKTDKTRYDDRNDEWYNFYQYCTNGIIQSFSNSNNINVNTIINWEYCYPKNPLFFTQVRHTLEYYFTNTTNNITTIVCDEEADHMIAKDAYNNSNSYVIGNDSDYCFFKNIQYIPLITLKSCTATTSTTNKLYGIVIRRNELATTLNLNNEQLLIELAILMGNDYIDPIDAQFNDIDTLIKKYSPSKYYKGTNITNNIKTISVTDTTTSRIAKFEEIIQFLQKKSKDYQVTSKLESTEEELLFIRTIYNFGNLIDFQYALQDKCCNIDDTDKNDVDWEDVQEKDNDDDDDDDESISIVPYVPDELEVLLSLVEVNPSKDRTIKDTVIRCLQTYIIKNLKNNHTSKVRQQSNCIQQIHIDTLREMIIDNSIATGTTTTTTTTTTSSTSTMPPTDSNWVGTSIVTELLKKKQQRNQQQQQQQQSSSSKSTLLLPTDWRPNWDDVVASHIIEKVLSYSYTINDTALVTKLSVPYNIYNARTFHTLLYNKRLQSQQQSSPQGNTTIYNISQQLGTMNLNGSKTPINNHNDYQNGNQDMTTAILPVVPVIAELVPVVQERVRLPVDEFENEILETVRKNRVTIIQGETGCGKSTRVPIMLLKSATTSSSNKKNKNNNNNKIKIFISVPRRIAAKALVEHLRKTEGDIGQQIALRMGHGVKEYESSITRAWFVTAGYLVRLMAGSPEKFDTTSHLIIDEVHERSIATDILCLLCRRLLAVNPTIKLILMSATLAAKLYTDYFNVATPPIKVGARRFPVHVRYIEDIQGMKVLSNKEQKKVEEVTAECSRLKCINAPSTSYVEKLHSIAAYLATSVSSCGSSVLIFVPGMNDIVSITELIERIHVVGKKFICLPVHSDIPFEDQMIVFEGSGGQEVKIIIATNSAESSVTLPDVDHVICLGLCKEIIYNPNSHRQMLIPTWISKSSADQRKGRTGRLRPGTVYRLYTAATYETYMDPFETGEMLRMPLDSVILNLKSMIASETVSKILQESLEPPNVETIERSFISLYQSHFINSPDDDGQLTDLGKFVAALGVDLRLGSVIGLGIQFGVGIEAIHLAAILSFPKSPWIMSNPLIHEWHDYNDITARAYVSKCCFDANLFSDPLATMNLIWEYTRINGERKAQQWCTEHAISRPRLRRLVTTVTSLVGRVAEFLSMDSSLLVMKHRPEDMPHAKVTLLRIIQAWVFNDSIISYTKSSKNGYVHDDQYTMVLDNDTPKVTRAHFELILHPVRHPFELNSTSTTSQFGVFESDTVLSSRKKKSDIFSDFEYRVVSYASDKGLNLIWIKFKDYCVLFALKTVAQSPEFQSFITNLAGFMQSTSLVASLKSAKKQRGAAERSCGKWSITVEDKNADDETLIPWKAFVLKINSAPIRLYKQFQNLIDQFCAKEVTESVIMKFGWNMSSDTRRRDICIDIRSTAIESISIVDIVDLFASSNVQIQKSHSHSIQKLLFPVNRYQEGCGIDDTKNVVVGQKTVSKSSSLHRPPIQCIPEGARLLSVLVSGRRRENFVMINALADNDTNQSNDKTLNVCFDSKQTNVAMKWKRFGSDKNVFTDSNSVAASAAPLNASDVLVCVCANTLELKGGALKVEGLTLLPRGEIFLLLCKATFGLLDGYKADIEGFVKKLLSKTGKDSSADEKKDLKIRLQEALRFNERSVEMGESLECFPDKVSELVAIFDGVDGHKHDIWDTLETDPFILHTR